MDCCICNPLAAVFRPPRYTICSSCYLESKVMLTDLQKLLDQRGIDESREANTLTPNSSKGLKRMMEVLEEMREKVDYFEEFVPAFKYAIHTDIKIKPFDGDAIPAHKALLATRSPIFKTMFELDDESQPIDTISLPDLNQEELHCFLEFLYSGGMSSEEFGRHAFSLLLAADKYEIPFLKKYCELGILESINSENALEVLELSVARSSQTLKEKAMGVIVEHMEEILFSSGYQEFALKNAPLSVEITRACFKESKDKIGRSS